MFCPHCKAEYRQGFTRCADCDIDLVYELPHAEKPEQKHLHGPLVLLYRTRDPAFLAFLKSVFMAEEIAYTVFGEYSMHLPTMSGGTEARIMVSEPDVQKAQALLHNILKEDQ